jgi:hypothetical protein
MDSRNYETSKIAFGKICFSLCIELNLWAVI